MADPANQRYLDHLKTIWESSRELAANSTVDENKAWHRFQQHIHLSGVETEREPARKGFSWVRVAAAAALIISVGIITWLIARNQDRPGEMEILAGQAVVNDTLPDGSVVTVNKRSSLSYTERGRKVREVTLTGEAFFNIVPNKKRPFIIHANDVQVTVLGTSFYVKAVEGVTEVIVETGIVQVDKGNDRIELHPGEKTTIANRDTALAEKPVTDQLHNYYRSKQFICDDTPLRKLVEVLNEAYGARIEIGNEQLKNLPLTVTFNNESLDQVLNVISLTFNIKIVRDGDRIVLQ